MKEKFDQDDDDNKVRATLKKKNTLVIKSTVDTSRASDCKKDIMKKISSNVEQVKTSKMGHLVINFADEDKMEDAKSDLDKVKDDINVTVDRKDMLKPKIQICDVDEDEDEDEIIDTIKDKNQWIDSNSRG